MLILRFPLKSFDFVEAKNVAHTDTDLDFGIIGEEAIRSTMPTDEVFQGV